MPSYKYNGNTYDIPADKVADFEAKYQDATMAYKDGDTIYDIPVSKREKFLSKYPNAIQWDDQTQKDTLETNLADFSAQYGDFMSEYESFEKHLKAPEMEPEYLPNYEAHMAQADEYNLRRSEREKMLKEYFSNPLVIKEREGRAGDARLMAESFAAAAGRMEQDNPELAKKAAKFSMSMIPGRGPLVLDDQTRQYREDHANYETARRFAEEAQEIYAAPSKYDDSVGVVNFLKGAKNVANSADFWTMGMSGIADNLNARDALAKVQEKLGSVDNLTEDNISQVLSPSEAALVTAWAANVDAQARRAEDLSRGYQAGQGATESLGFMAQFLLTGGVGKAVSEAATKGMTKWLAGQLGKMSSGAVKSVAKGAAKGVLGTVKSLTKAAVQTPLMPSTYENISEVMLEIDDSGKLIEADQAFWTGLADSMIETWSESAGGMVEEILGVPLKLGKSAWNKALGETSFGKWGQSLTRTPAYKLMKQAGWNGYIGELGEEWLGNSVRTLTGLDPDALKDFATVDQQIITMTSFAPMAVFGLGASAAQYKAAKNRAANAAEALSGVLQQAGYSQGQISFVLDDMNASTPRQLSETLTPVVNQIAKDTGFGSEAFKAVMNYADAMAKYRTLDGFYQREQESKMLDARGDIESKTKQLFYQIHDTGKPSVTGDGNVYIEEVRVVENSDGSRFFVVGQSEDGTLAAVDEQGGKRFITEDEITRQFENGSITSDQTMMLRDFLSAEVVRNQQAAEQARMTEDARNAVAQIRQVAQPGTEVNLGTAEAPVVGIVRQQETGDGVVVQTEAGVSQLSWEEAGRVFGIDATPRTDEEIEAGEVAQIEATRAERMTRFAQTADEAAGAEIEALDALSEESVAEPLPLKADGSVDQTSLWNQNPERWAEWNDEQRQDGGVNSLGYINGAIAREEAAVAELTAAYNAEPDFDTRASMESQVKAVNERLNRLVALQQKYAPLMQAEAPMAEEASEKEAQPASGPTEAAPAESIQETDPVRQTLMELYNDEELTESEIEDYINANAKKAQSDLDKHMSKAPKMGTDMAKYKADRAKHQEKTVELEKQRDFWKEVQSYIEVPEVSEMDMEPQDALEFTANELTRKNGIKLQRDSFARHTGYGAEAGNFLTILRTKANGGLTLEEAGERLMEMDRENNTGFFDQNDPNAGLNAILAVIAGARTSGDISGYIRANREQVAKEQVAAARNAMMEDIKQSGTGNEVQPSYVLSDEVDENGRQFVLSPNGTISFGEITNETGLTPAPILLSEGLITNPATNDGYGLVHIEARHGDQIRNAGYDSIIDFVAEVASNYEVIREGKNIDGHQTYMLQLTDKHNNTLMVELSGDGTYWNINTAGIFKTSYGANRKEVYNRHTTDKQFVETAEASQVAEQSDTQTTSSMNAPTTSSDSKDSDSVESTMESDEKVEDVGDIPDEIWYLSDEEAVRRATEMVTTEQDRVRLEEEKRAVLRERIKEWEQKLGVQVDVMESVDVVTNAQAKQQILSGNRVYGWFNPASGKVAFYLPDYVSLPSANGLSEIDKTYIHEVVSHKGLRGLLGEEKYDELCDRVWDMMSAADRNYYISYPGVNGSQRVAADEYIAHFAETVELTEQERTIWDKIVDFINNLIGNPMSKEALSSLIRQSYTRLAKSASIDANANQQAEGNAVFRAGNGSLVGMHNISEEKLRKVIKMGGSANPSTAVIDIDRQDFASYGDISLVMPSSLVDAGTGRNAGTFTADAWTPTYPQVSKRFSDDKLQRVYWRDISAIPEEMSHEVRMAFDSWLDNRNASGLAYMFLHERGEAPEMVRVEAKYPQEIKDKVSAILGEGRTGLYNLSAEEKQAMLELYIQENFGGNREEFDKSIADRIQRIEDRLSTGKVSSFVEKRITLDLQWMKEHAYDYDELSKFVSAITADIRHAGEVNDAATTDRALDYIKDNGLEKEFDRWKESLNDRYGIKEYLFDGYTPSGNQRWLPNTVENASRLMNKRGLAGATGMAASFNRFVATLAPKKKTLSDIRASKDRLVEDEKLVDDFREKWSEVFFDLGIKCQPDAKGYEDYGLARLTEAAQKKNPGAYLKKEYGVELSQEDLQKLSEMIKAIKTEFPARYFETKFQRPVYLNEFAAVVMPTTTSEDIRQAVSEAGLPIFEYDSTVEGSRKEATMRATEEDGVRFRTRITPEMDKAYMDAVEAGDMETAQRMVNEAARLVGYDSNSDYQGSLAFNGAAPSGYAYYDTKEERIEAWENGNMEDDQTLGDYKDAGVDISNLGWSLTSPVAQRMGNKYKRESIKNLADAVISDSRKIKVYRAVDADIKEDSVRNGDWVTPSRAYAEHHIRLQDWKEGRIIEQEVDIDDIWWDGNDINEWGYNDGQGYAYKNTSNNRKLLDPVTYDNDGNVIPLSERFNPENEDIRFRVSNENQAIFVSNAAKAVEGIKQEKATPEQWLKMIEKAGGLKAGEDKWMGLSDWLKASDKKTLTKAEVLDFINENMIIIEEQHYSEDENALDGKRQEIQEALQGIFDEYVAESEDMNDDMFMKTHYDYAIQKLADELGYTAFNAPFVNNNAIVELDFYEDDLDTLHELSYRLGLEKYDGTRNINDTRLNYTTEGLTDRHEIALTVPTIEPWDERDDVHFGDAGDGRAIAWIRFGETEKLLGTTEVDGKKKFNWARVLVIDEIQSNRHQEGRERGYISKKKAQELKDKFEKAKERYIALDSAFREKYGADFVNSESNDDFMEVLNPEEYREFMNAQMDYSDARLEMNNPRYDAVPDAPFDKNWHELAMKRMLRYAAENGYDVVAWTKGEQQAERYNIGDVVTSVDYRLNNDGTYHVDTMGSNGYQMEEVPTTFSSEAELAEIFGKEIARKIAGNLENDKKTIAEADKEIGKLREWFSKNVKTDESDLDSIFESVINNPEQSERWNELEVKKEEARRGRSLSETDFRIGGEGMKGFYDKILPAFMNKYGKKWGVKVEDIKLNGLENGLIMHSVPVTEEMKASVMEGQVMFRVRDENESAEEFHGKAIANYLQTFNEVAPIKIGSLESKAALAKSLDVPEEKITDEVFEAILAGYEQGGYGGYIDALERIVIFAREEAYTTELLEQTLFHESIHKIDFMDIEDGEEFGEWLWENADNIEDLSIFRDMIEASPLYEDDGFAEEMLANSISWYMMIGEVDNLLGQIPEEFRETLNTILNEIGYETEDQSRLRQDPKSVYARAKRLFRQTVQDAQRKRNDQEGIQENEIGYDRRTEEGRREAERILQQSSGANNLGEPEGIQKNEESEEGDIRFRVADSESKREIINNTEPVDVTKGMIVATDGESVSKAALRWFEENVGKELTYNTEVGTVAINRRSVKNSLAHGYSQTKLDAITSLPEGFGRAVYLASEDDFDGKPEVNHYFVYPINYDGSIHYVLCRVKSDVNKSSLYIHEVFPIGAIKGHTLQTAADQSQPHRGISLYLDLLKEVLYGKDTDNLETTNDSAKNIAYAVNENPTEAQKEAGNYKMGHLNLDGYRITIENPKGSVRRGTDSKGNAWENTLNNDYGYIRGTEGVDGDHIDVYLSDNPSEGNVFVIDQVNPETREFDEHKVMYGFNSAEEAREAYLANFSEGWNGLGTITEVSKDEFKKWIQSSHRKTKPFSEYKSVNAIGSQSEGVVEEDLRPATGTPTDKVVASGLSLSPAQTATLAGNIFAALPESARAEVTASLNGDILGLQDAIMQIPARLATKEDWSDEDRQMADIVASEVTKIAGELTRPFSAPEALWLLYDALNKPTDLISEAQRVLVQRNLGFDAETQEVIDEAKDGVRFRTVGDASDNARASMYNKGAVNVWSRLKESFVDMNDSVEKLVKAMEKASGKVAQGFENILLALNQQSSKGLAAMERYEKKYLGPMLDEVKRIIKDSKKTYEDVVRYVILKHGLERNETFAKRDAREFYSGMFDKVAARMKTQSHAQRVVSLSDAKRTLADIESKIASATGKKLERLKEERELAMQEVTVAELVLRGDEKQNEADLKARMDAIDAGTDAKYLELRDTDYSGITSMFYDQLDVNRADYETEEEYQAALMLAKNDRYKTLADVEAAAQQEVDAFESGIDTTALWNKINAATKEILRQQYQSNMISKDQYESLRDMFQYYVPLRGFADNTAEDMYTYYRRPNSTGYTKPILGAEGRKTEAESPFGWIAAMAGSAIASNVKNEAKLALFYFVSNRPDNGIATISKTWFEFSHTDPDTGKKVYKPVYPPFTEDLSSDAAKAAYEQWQKDMEAKRAAGQAYESGQRLNLGNSVVNISDVNKPEHIVTVKVGGKDYTILINGNPRAAQAINGDLNIEATGSADYSKVLGPWLRWLSNVNTSYNPEFWFMNMQRDMLFTLMNVSASQTPEYRKKFANNYMKAFKVVSLVAKNEKGALGSSYIENMYKDFVEYGGVTGYTQIKDSETWEKEIERMMNSANMEDKTMAKVLSGTKDVLHTFHRFGESLEQVSRFAAFMTSREMGKSMVESISDAKEITVNFNRKGSGKMISWEETKHLTGKSGKPLNGFQRMLAWGVSSMAPLGRRFIMFFNAAIQGLNAMYRLYKNNPSKMAGWSIGYAAVGIMQALLHGLLDDDDDYLDIPQYERRTALLLGANGVYFKWALPQEARAFYALGELAVETIMGRNPHQNIITEALKIASDVAPINPAEGIMSVIPSQVKPLVELWVNKDWKGDPIYNDQKWLSKEERRRTAKHSSAFKGTGKLYIDISKGLNKISGGDDFDAGLINIQPEKMEHIVQSAFGGTIRTIDKFFNSVTAAIDPDEPVTVRQFPFINQFLTINDERFKNVHVNDVYEWYAGEAEHILTLQKKYKKVMDSKAYGKLIQSDEYRWAQIYSRYKKPIKNLQEQIKVADGTVERMELMKRQDELKRQMIKEISQLP